MCVAPEMINLCGNCGCTEIQHDEPSSIDNMLMAGLDFSPQGRGKCHGQIPLPLDIEMIKAAREKGETIQVTRPCNCKKFKSVFNLHNAGELK
jgi:hypothetical protein